MSNITIPYHGLDVDVEYTYTTPFKGSAYNCPSDIDWYGEQEIHSAVYVESGVVCEATDEELWKIMDKIREEMGNENY